MMDEIKRNGRAITDYESSEGDENVLERQISTQQQENPECNIERDSQLQTPDAQTRNKTEQEESRSTRTRGRLDRQEQNCEERNGKEIPGIASHLKMPL